MKVHFPVWAARYLCKTKYFVRNVWAQGNKKVCIEYHQYVFNQSWNSIWKHWQNNSHIHTERQEKIPPVGKMENNIQLDITKCYDVSKILFFSFLTFILEMLFSYIYTLKLIICKWSSCMYSMLYLSVT